MKRQKGWDTGEGQVPIGMLGQDAPTRLARAWTANRKGLAHRLLEWASQKRATVAKAIARLSDGRLHRPHGLRAETLHLRRLPPRASPPMACRVLVTERLWRGQVLFLHANRPRPCAHGSVRTLHAVRRLSS